MDLVAGVTNQSTVVRAMTGTGALAGKLAADFTLWYRRDGGKVPISLSDLGAIDGAHSDGGIIEIDDGWYRLDLPDAAVAGGVALVSIGGSVDGGVVLSAPITLTEPDAGSGARTVTIRVNDGTDPLENARVRLSEGINEYTALTNASGVATFNLDDATYDVAITKSGYSYAGTSLVVDGNETATYSMTATVITPPSDPALATVTVLCVNQAGAPEAGVEVYASLVAVPSGSSGYAFDGIANSAVSDANGVATLTLVRLAKYLFRRGGSTTTFQATIPNEGATTVGSFIGQD